RAKPLFPEHYQPQLPADLGFYDLRLPETRQAQADLAREYGVHGFCYYHYWFKGRRLLERPFQEVLDSGEPDFPFCLAWANHTWTWKRDHSLQGRLMEQEYSEEDDREHIRWLLIAFQDERYIRVNGRPLLLIYWAASLPNPERTFEIWNEEAERAGEASPYVCKVDSFGNFDDPRELGCDAAVEFWPHGVETMIQRVGGPEDFYNDNQIFEYRQLVINNLARRLPEWKRYSCVVPHWDNTARWKAAGARLLRGSTPELYKAWLEGVVAKTAAASGPDDEQLIFINAWNEWGEGTYLEPDLKYGRAYLEATRQALVDAGAEVNTNGTSRDNISVPASAEERYDRMRGKYEDLQRRFAEHLSFEERSPLVQRAEQRYDELLGEYTRLRRENSSLERRHEDLQQRVVRMEERMASLSAENQSARQMDTGAYDRLVQDHDRLVGWLQLAEREISVLLNSRRWQASKTLDRIVNTALRKPQVETPEDRLQEVMRQFRTLSKKQGRD
ncbi:MAG: glycoside hydrolase family 99-like domain-containing protein, partial [Rubrobacteraceae bacterium]